MKGNKFYRNGITFKIAVATEDGTIISAHFGRSPYFVIYYIEDDKIISKNLRKNTFTGHFSKRTEDPELQDDIPHRHGAGDPHKHHSVAEGLKDCQVVVSHGMGRKAWEDLREKGVEMIVTDETGVEKAVEMYLSGELEDRIEKLH